MNVNDPSLLSVTSGESLTKANVQSVLPLKISLSSTFSLVKVFPPSTEYVSLTADTPSSTKTVMEAVEKSTQFPLLSVHVNTFAPSCKLLTKVDSELIEEIVPDPFVDHAPVLSIGVPAVNVV